MTDQKERLKKLYVLALRGVGGEKEQASEILDRLLKKYAMTLEQLDEEIICEYEIKYSGAEEEQILKQTVYKVTDDSGAFYRLYYVESGRKCKNALGVKCTAAQKSEIEFLFDFYKRIYKQEKEALLEAFIQKHRIFGNLKDGEKSRELTMEQQKKLSAIMAALSNEKPLMQIEGGSI